MTLGRAKDSLADIKNFTNPKVHSNVANERRKIFADRKPTGLISEYNNQRYLFLPTYGKEEEKREKVMSSTMRKKNCLVACLMPWSNGEDEEEEHEEESEYTYDSYGGRSRFFKRIDAYYHRQSHLDSKVSDAVFDGSAPPSSSAQQTGGSGGEDGNCVGQNNNKIGGDIKGQQQHHHHRRGGVESTDSLFGIGSKSSNNNDIDSSQRSSSSRSSTRRLQQQQNRRRGGGILKRSSLVVQLSPGTTLSRRESFRPTDFRRGGSGIFGSKRWKFADGNDGNGNNDSWRQNRIVVKFDPIVTVTDVMSWQEMPPQERLETWWQRADFDEFKRDIVLLTKEAEAMCCETMWQNGGSSSDGTGGGGGGGVGGAGPLGLTPPGRQDSTDSTCSNNGDRKWWHKYDHSRRGLEKKASASEWNETMKYIRLATEKVLDEQMRQKKQKGQRSLVVNFGGRNDPPVDYDGPELIAREYREYNAWSRDLALAAAASDADAVITDFDEELRKTREYYLLKQIMSNGGAVHRHTPPFMVPKGIMPKGYIDEHNEDTRYLENKRRSSGKQQTNSAPGRNQQTREGGISKQAMGFGGGGVDMAAKIGVVKV